MLREGICCSCQLPQPIVPKGVSPEDLDDPFILPPEEGEVGEWVMAIHDAFGSHCKGSGEMPQAVLREETQAADTP